MSVETQANDIRAEFDFLDDWETRYAHIIDLGKANPALAPDERTEATRVRGCASQVWMVISEQEDDTLEIRAESDAMIVSGLIALLIRLFSGAPREEILAFDTPAFLEDIGVTGALSAQRSNGLASMLERIRTVASAQTTGG
ncbi:MAG: SufE family protein [Henriciella sp.]|uniref:SufE family protein n=1 Tax=Henriciella sp. TaxID=1968823 RepID=UPI003C743451